MSKNPFSPKSFFPAKESFSRAFFKGNGEGSGCSPEDLHGIEARSPEKTIAEDGLEVFHVYLHAVERAADSAEPHAAECKKILRQPYLPSERGPQALLVDGNESPLVLEEPVLALTEHGHQVPVLA